VGRVDGPNCVDDVRAELRDSFDLRRKRGVPSSGFFRREKVGVNDDMADTQGAQILDRVWVGEVVGLPLISS
jgi:hypothetical protein